MIGKQILNYRIEKLIGKGGMGSVYLASNINIDQKVAVKVLNPDLAHNDQIKKRFQREAVTLASLDHPNIVKFLNYVENEEGIFLIMEYVRGRTLDDYIKNVSGPVTEERILNLFGAVLDAFTYAHKQGVVHRDIKPSNILITNDLKVKILDFGIARIIKETVPGMTEAGTKMGTAMYMSPEQVRGKDVDSRSDIYALGVVLHQMVTGVAPYDDTTMSEFDINVRVVEEKLPRAKTFYPYVSDKMQTIIDKACEKEVHKRYQSCEEFKYDVVKAIKPEEAVKPKTRPVSKWSLVAAGVVLLIASFWFWDYSRVKTRYYKDFVEQWGVPQGIHKLSRNDVKHRNASYRFEYRKGKLRRFTRVNSAGKIREHNDSEHTEHPNDMKLYYSDNGKLSYSEYLDRNGKVLFKKVYNANLNVVTFKHADEFETEFALSARTTESFKSPFSDNSDEHGQISRYLITYDKDGYPEKIQYAKYQNILAGDKDGIFGRLYVRDSKGRVTEEHYLGYDGKPKATKKGMGMKKHVYDENDDWTETHYLDVNGGQAYEELTGVPVVKLHFDKYGNRTSEEYCSANGTLVLRRDVKCAGSEYKYDNRGNVIENFCFDTERKICTAYNGVAGYEAVYDEDGNIVKMTCFDAEHHPCLSNDGNAGYEAVFDAKGNMIEQWMTDEKGRPCLVKDGYAGYKVKLDSLGNPVEYMTYGIDKKPCLQNDGTAGYQAQYNAMNKIVKLINIGTDLMPCYDKNDLAIVCFRYDKRGNETGRTFFDKTGKHRKSGAENIAGWNSEYDDQGNEISRSFYNADSTVCLVDDGYAKWTARFDERGNQVAVRYFGTDGKLCLSGDGYAGWNSGFDERGNVIETTYVDTREKPLEGYLICKYAYDEKDNETESWLYNADGTLDLNSDGYAGYRSAYNDRNQEIERKYFGKNKQAVKIKDGYSIVRYQYDDRGNQTEAAYFDENGHPCLTTDKIARQTSSYNSQGQVIRQIYYDENGNPASYQGGSPEVTAKYDKWGNITELACYDGKGNLTKGENGFAVKKLEFDRKGNLLMEAFFDVREKPCYAKEGHYAKGVYAYNSNGKLTESKYYSDDGQLRKKEYAIIRTTYNDQGQEAETAYFDNQDHPCNYAADLPYCRFVNEYENSGKLLRTKYYKLNGDVLATLDPEGNRVYSNNEVRNYVSNIATPQIIVDGLEFEKASLNQTTVTFVWRLTDWSMYEMSDSKKEAFKDSIKEIAEERDDVKNLSSINYRVSIRVQDKAGRKLFYLNF